MENVEGMTIMREEMMIVREGPIYLYTFNIYPIKDLSYIEEIMNYRFLVTKVTYSNTHYVNSLTTILQVVVRNPYELTSLFNVIKDLSETIKNMYVEMRELSITEFYKWKESD